LEVLTNNGRYGIGMFINNGIITLNDFSVNQFKDDQTEVETPNAAIINSEILGSLSTKKIDVNELNDDFINSMKRWLFVE